MENYLYWLWICNIEKVWNATIRKILDVFGTPKEAFEANEKVLCSELAKIAGINEKVINRIVQSRDMDRIKRICEKLNQNEVRFIHYESRKYPDKLRNINHPPYGLYIKGHISDIARYVDEENRYTVSIVGARNCTAYGRKIAGDLGFELASNGVNVVSGMAVGIDGAGHWGALRAWNTDRENQNTLLTVSNGNMVSGITIAVLGCGVDICYPIQNYELYEGIIKTGAVISEYPLGMQPFAWQFPQRNRIISGLSDRIIVVEAREKSGSLITVEYGLEQGKDIYAVPGRIGDSLSSGCNRLIKEGAGILTTSGNIMKELELGELYHYKNSKNKNIILAKDLELVYSCVDYFPKSVEHIIEETGMEMTLVFRNIITLQLMGLIEEQAKNYYVRM